MEIDLLRQVQDSNGNVGEIVSINIKIDNGDLIAVDYNNFIDSYQNYVDPKDAEIARLKAIIDELQNPPARKHRTRLTDDEWKEVKGLIRDGVGNQVIANEYDISDSSVSKKRIEMRKMGEHV